MKNGGVGRAYMNCATAIDPDWIPALAMQRATPASSNGSTGDIGGGGGGGGASGAAAMLTHPLLKLSAPLSSPAPTFDVGRDAVVCFVTPRFGADGWRLRPVPVPLGDVASPEVEVRWFARLLLEGKVPLGQGSGGDDGDDDGVSGGGGKAKKRKKKDKKDKKRRKDDGDADAGSSLLGPHVLNDPPALLTSLHQRPSKKILVLVSALLRPPPISSVEDIDGEKYSDDDGEDDGDDESPIASLAALRRRLTKDRNFLASALRLWIRTDTDSEERRLLRTATDAILGV